MGGRGWDEEGKRESLSLVSENANALGEGSLVEAAVGKLDLFLW